MSDENVSYIRKNDYNLQNPEHIHDLLERLKHQRYAPDEEPIFELSDEQEQQLSYAIDSANDEMKRAHHDAMQKIETHMRNLLGDRKHPPAFLKISGKEAEININLRLIHNKLPKNEKLFEFAKTVEVSQAVTEENPTGENNALEG